MSEGIMTVQADFGVIGMAVMGRNLAMNIADHGFRVVVYNRSAAPAAAAVAASEGRLQRGDTLEAFVAALERPRRIMMMVKAGEPVDAVLQQLRPLLSEGDIVIDGGNSWFLDTQRRERELRAAGLRFIGTGVSGGEEGARHGPALMPGGDREAYAAIAPVFEAIAARTPLGPCVTYVGPDGAGHFVKMVHNGIEYADMQCIAEAYDLLRRLFGLPLPRIADIFDDWNKGLLESFLIEITAKVLRVKDSVAGGHLIDHVLDKAGQKGTGRWTAQVALELGVPVPSIAAAIDARVLSSMKAERVAASEILPGPTSARVEGDPESWVPLVRDALYAAKIGAYAQGMALIRAASREHDWGIDLEEIARIWTGGCIIRARFLGAIMQAYHRAPDLVNLLLDDSIRQWMEAAQDDWRRIVAQAAGAGIPVPGMSAGLAYYDSYRSKRLPQNLTQAQRDAFGAHTYQRVGDPDGVFVHTEWLG
jgi:6-phosphogluconate dehydrogenase